MPRPRLGEPLRRTVWIGLVGLSGWLPAARCEDAVLDDRVVPAQFRREKPDELEDSFPYQGLTIVKPGTSSTR